MGSVIAVYTFIIVVIKELLPVMIY